MEVIFYPLFYKANGDDLYAPDFLKSRAADHNKRDYVKLEVKTTTIRNAISGE